MHTLRLIIGGFVLGAASALLVTQAVSQEHQMPSPEEMERMMQEYMAVTQPGEKHRLLDRSIGSWDTTMRVWMNGPTAEPTITKGTATRRWVLDGRFVLEEMEAVMLVPDATGQPQQIPWKGMGFTGYDNYRNMYVGNWCDSLSTHMLTMKGSCNQDGTVFTSYGEMDEPMLGVVGRLVKYETRVISEDESTFSVYDLHAGDDYKVIEITYARQQ